MPTDWGKVLEVFSSGIIGVFIVMFLVQLLTQVSTWAIDAIENRYKAANAEQKPEKQCVSAKG